jgi:hypothetical protein
MNYPLNKKKIFDILQSGDAQPLEETYEIEDIIVILSEMDKKRDFLTKLKKNRIGAIDEEIAKIDHNEEMLKAVIKATLEKAKMKALSFPSVGKVICKSSKGKWSVTDEQSLIKELATSLTPDQYNMVVKAEPTIQKKELNGILDNMEKSNQLPSSVKREDGKESISVTFDKGIGKHIEKRAEETVTPSNEDIVGDMDFDNLEI